MVVNLAQIPSKSVMMDVVVADVPGNYGMLLSRSWGTRLGGTLQLDMSHVTMPILGEQTKRLYRVTKDANILSDSSRPQNHPVYEESDDMGCGILVVEDEEGVCLVE